MTGDEEIAMCELFAVVDDVMTEDDAMHDTKLRMGLGRIQRQWRKTRAVLGASYSDNKA